MCSVHTSWSELTLPLFLSTLLAASVRHTSNTCEGHARMRQPSHPSHAAVRGRCQVPAPADSIFYELVRASAHAEPRYRGASLLLISAPFLHQCSLVRDRFLTGPGASLFSSVLRVPSRSTARMFVMLWQWVWV